MPLIATAQQWKYYSFLALKYSEPNLTKMVGVCTYSGTRQGLLWRVQQQQWTLGLLSLSKRENMRSELSDEVRAQLKQKTTAKRTGGGTKQQ